MLNLFTARRQSPTRVPSRSPAGPTDELHAETDPILGNLSNLMAALFSLFYTNHFPVRLESQGRMHDTTAAALSAESIPKLALTVFALIRHPGRMRNNITKVQTQMTSL